MTRRRDALGMFLSNKTYPHNYFEQEYNLFEDKDQDINPLAKLFANFEDPVDQDPVENPFALIIYRARMVDVAQNRLTQLLLNSLSPTNMIITTSIISLL